MLVGSLGSPEPGRKAAAMAMAGQDGSPPAGRLDLLVVVRVASAQALTAKKGKKWGYGGDM